MKAYADLETHDITPLLHSSLYNSSGKLVIHRDYLTKYNASLALYKNNLFLYVYACYSPFLTLVDSATSEPWEVIKQCFDKAKTFLIQMNNKLERSTRRRQEKTNIFLVSHYKRVLTTLNNLEQRALRMLVSQSSDLSHILLPETERAKIDVVFKVFYSQYQNEFPIVNAWHPYPEAANQRWPNISWWQGCVSVGFALLQLQTKGLTKGQKIKVHVVGDYLRTRYLIGSTYSGFSRDCRVIRLPFNYSTNSCRFRYSDAPRYLLTCPSSDPKLPRCDKAVPEAKEWNVVPHEGVYFEIFKVADATTNPGNLNTHHLVFATYEPAESIVKAPSSTSSTTSSTTRTSTPKKKSSLSVSASSTAFSSAFSSTLSLLNSYKIPSSFFAHKTDIFIPFLAIKSRMDFQFWSLLRKPWGKNWTPFWHNNRLCLSYQFFPHQVLLIDDKDHGVALLLDTETKEIIPQEPVCNADKTEISEINSNYLFIDATPSDEDENNSGNTDNKNINKKRKKRMPIYYPPHAMKRRSTKRPTWLQFRNSYSYFSLGTSPIHYSKDEYLAVGHSRIHHDDIQYGLPSVATTLREISKTNPKFRHPKLDYFMFFYTLNKTDLQVNRISNSFIVGDHLPFFVQFPMGIIPITLRKRVHFMISYGEGDARSKLLVISKKSIETLLHPLETFPTHAHYQYGFLYSNKA